MTDLQAMTNSSQYIKWRKMLKTLNDTESAKGRALHRAIGAVLTGRQAQMVTMYYLNQQTMVGIAESLGVNISTVSRTLKSSRGKLAKALEYSKGTGFGEYED